MFGAIMKELMLSISALRLVGREFLIADRRALSWENSNPKFYFLTSVPLW